MLAIDGTTGEGGGQILRTSLALSAITGTPFQMHDVRAKRSRPGLLRQHLTGVLAAAEVCGADVTGAHLGSRELRFEPGARRSGAFEFAVGTAGSANLVLQTILPILLHAPGPSTVVVRGGTHNDGSPPWHFLSEAFLPLLRRMGADVTTTLDRWGFYPAGGGAVTVDVRPGPLRPVAIGERGEVELHAWAAVAGGVRVDVAKRELAVLGDRLGIPADRRRWVHAESPGPGNVTWVEAVSDRVTEVFTGFGARGVLAETVAGALADEVAAWLESGAPVGEHLADQLLLPLALAGGGSFLTVEPTLHTTTNMEVIRMFLPVAFDVSRAGRHTRIDVRGA